MKAAWVSGVLGLVLCVSVGESFGWSLRSILLYVLACNLIGITALLVVLRLEAQPRFKKRYISGISKTWTLMSLLYLPALWIAAWIFAPELSVVRFWVAVSQLLALFVPGVISTGFGWLAFGPIQDAYVHKTQRAKREASLHL